MGAWVGEGPVLGYLRQETGEEFPENRKDSVDVMMMFADSRHGVFVGCSEKGFQRTQKNGTGGKGCIKYFIFYDIVWGSWKLRGHEGERGRQRASV